MAWIFGLTEFLDTISNFDVQWYWFVIATLYATIIVDVFFHVTLAHRTFEVDVNSITYKILVFLHTSLNVFGTVRQMVLTHDLHHRYPDIPGKDTLNPRTSWYSTCSVSPIMYIYQYPLQYDNNEWDDYMAEQKSKFQHVIDDPWTRFCDQHTVAIIILTWSALAIVWPVFLFKVIFMGRFLTTVWHLLSTLGHIKLPFGYRNFETPDHSHNNLLFHYLALGCSPTMLQNNHHGKDFTHTHAHRWFELDFGSMIMRYVLKPLMMRRA